MLAELSISQYKNLIDLTSNKPIARAAGVQTNNIAITNYLQRKCSARDFLRHQIQNRDKQNIVCDILVLDI